MPITRADRARAVDVHLATGCRRKRKPAVSTDPRAVTCRVCLRSRRWRSLARRVVRSMRVKIDIA